MYTVQITLSFVLLGLLCLRSWAAPSVNRNEEEPDPELTAGYFQGDMEVDYERNGELSATLHWPNATVYYKIDEEFGKPLTIYVYRYIHSVNKHSIRCSTCCTH